MYSLANNHDNPSILSLKEIFGIVVVFSVVLYLLFPKNDIESILETNRGNTNLSINYLESMLLYYPDNIKLQMILIENYYRRKDLKKATALNEKLIEKIDDKTLLTQLYKNRYLILKEQYFQINTPKTEKISINHVQETLLNYFEYNKKNRDYLFFFSEATQMDIPSLEYKALQGLMRHQPELINPYLEEQAFSLAITLQDHDGAYFYLEKLLDNKTIRGTLKEDALNLLMNQKEYDKVANLATKLFLTTDEPSENIKFFSIALYALGQNPNHDDNAIQTLIEQYQSRHALQSYDIVVILNSFLQVGNLDGANHFVQETFKTHPEIFDEPAIELAINSFIYNNKLPFAQELAYFAYENFPEQKWLDKNIQLALWLGDIENTIAFNKEGYEVFGDPKYETYFLESSTLDTAYEMLGEIYHNKIESGDHTFVDKVAEYYEYMGEISEGESYFLNLLEETKNEPIHKQAILFSYYNNHLIQGLNLYATYKKAYGIDKELQELSIENLLAFKEFKKAQQFTEELETTKVYNAKAQQLLEKLHLPSDSTFYTQLIDLAWIHKSYPYLYKILWKLEQQKTLTTTGYERLILLERALNKGERIAYLYEQSWEKTAHPSYLFALFYEYIKEKNFEALEKLRASLNKRTKENLEKNIQYHLLMANYYTQISHIDKALQSFQKAFTLDKNSVATHQAYLWFLLDNKNTKALISEINLLQKSPKLQAQVGFGSVVGAMQLQNSDLAIRWLKPLLDEDKENMEYQVLYADILQFQDRTEASNQIKMRLFKRLNTLIKKDATLLTNKDFARIYLQLATRYVTPFEKRGIYFDQLALLFDEKEFIQMKIGWYSLIHSDDKVQQIKEQYHLDIPWLNLYLAMNQDNNFAKQQLLHYYKNILPFRDRVMASLDIGDRAGAYSLAFKGLEENRQDVDLYKIFDDMVNVDYQKTELSSTYTHLSDQFSLIESHVSQRLALFKGIESTLAFTQYHYQQNPQNIEDNSLSLTLKNSHKKLLWDFKLEQHDSEHDFISTSLNSIYKLSDLTLGVNLKYHNKTTQTPELQANGMMNSWELNLQKPLSHRIQIGASYKENHYQNQDQTQLGNSQHVQLSGNYILRAGYPDININNYLTINRYDWIVQNNLLPKNFWELGSQISIGGIAQNTLHRNWKPFGTIGIAINDQQNIGSSLSLGIAGMVKGEDLLSVLLNYSQGVGVITNPVYGVALEYRF